jgi:hypothetical protein
MKTNSKKIRFETFLGKFVYRELYVRIESKRNAKNLEKSVRA